MRRDLEKFPDSSCRRTLAWPHAAGLLAPVISLIVSIGIGDVAGASKKSFQAALIFIFYDVGNIVGPQLVKTQTIKRHYPELWRGTIICYYIVIVLALVLHFC
jgi:hypothetical protein